LLGPEDPLRKALDGLAAPADPAGAYERIVEKKIRRQIYRKLEIGALAVVVLAGTVGGTFVLASAFLKGNGTPRQPPAQGLAENGLIAFVSNRDGNSDVFVMHHDGSHVLNLTRDPADDHGPAFSPNGAQIAFVSNRDGDPDVYVMNADGTDVHRVSHLAGFADAPSWSPDGTRIAFVDNSEVEGGHRANYQLYVMVADGSQVTRLSRDLNLNPDSRPAWSPDGTHIAFSSARLVHPYSCPVTHTCPLFHLDEILVAAADGSQVRQLSSVPGNASAPSWSPDGESIAFQSDGHIYVMGKDGKGVRRLTKGPTVDGAPSWSPDGTKLVLSSEVNGSFGIDVVDLSGSHRRTLASGVSAQSAPSWQPVPKGHPPVTPTRPPTETPSPSPTLCEHSPPVQADFDGDGLVDTAFVGAAECLPSPEGTADYSVHVVYGDGRDAIYPITVCRSVCRGLGAADLNDDGIDELFIVVDQGASTQFLSLLELQNGETAGGEATTVGDPGAPGFPTDEPAIFEYGGAVTHQGHLTCRSPEKGHEQVISTTAMLNDQQTEWEAHETVFTFSIVQGDGVPFPKLDVVSTEDYTQPFDPTGKELFKPRGDDCLPMGL
jgi:Tol biopolymer transport system component